ncbi:hypothetical protein KM043_014105 [Ampulex compressa]|nr:hypothetical protein KM043_014105 [Ampulex compressa]
MSQASAMGPWPRPAGRSALALPSAANVSRYSFHLVLPDLGREELVRTCLRFWEAYRKWVCSSLVPYFAHGGPRDLETSEGSWTGSRLRPCRSFCQSVEQRCPYLLPGDRAPAYPTQYAGEPTFLCRDPNIPETGGQAARALHSSEDDECCFHVCSEEEPGSGYCANCTDREPRKRGRSRDPPTAPHCEITPIQSDPTGQPYPGSQSEGSTDRSIEIDQEDGSSPSSLVPTSGVVQQHQQQQGTSLCGSGGVGSMSVASSSGRSTASLLPRLLWLCPLLLYFLQAGCGLPSRGFLQAAVAILASAGCGGRPLELLAERWARARRLLLLDSWRRREEPRSGARRGLDGLWSRWKFRRRAGGGCLGDPREEAAPARGGQGGALGFLARGSAECWCRGSRTSGPRPEKERVAKKEEEVEAAEGAGREERALLRQATAALSAVLEEIPAIGGLVAEAWNAGFFLSKEGAADLRSSSRRHPSPKSKVELLVPKPMMSAEKQRTGAQEEENEICMHNLDRKRLLEDSVSKKR